MIFKNIVRWTGNILAGLAFIFSFFLLEDLQIAIVNFILGIAFLWITIKFREEPYGYPAVGLISISYLFIIKHFIPIDFYLLYALVWFIILLGIPLIFNLKFKEKEEKDSLDLVQPINITCQALMVITAVIVTFNCLLIENPLLFVFTLALYIATSICLCSFYRESWYLLFLVLFFAILTGGVSFNFLKSPVTYGLILIVAYLSLIHNVYKFNKDEILKPIYSGAISVAFFLVVLVYFIDLGQAGNFILIISSIIFVLGAVHFKKIEFAYLIVLAMAVLAHNFIRISQDSYYYSLIEYLLYGVFILGIIFLYPWIKKLFRYSWSIAQASVGTSARVFYIFTPVILIFLYFIFDYTMIVTENSHFCGYCHTMKVPYETWKTNMHYKEGVGCFSCHYAPGTINFFKGRTSGTMMVIKTWASKITGSLPSISSSNVSDLACMQEGCHKDKTAYYNKEYICKIFKNSRIKIVHKTMMEQNVRDIKLRCGSCHSKKKEVEGEHFTINNQVCYLCHLRDIKDAFGTAVGTCYTCHDTSRERIEEKSFVTVGDGKAPIEKCFTCHWKAERYNDTKYMHDVHYNNYTEFVKPKIACEDCHNEIKHGSFGIQVTSFK
jgi:nitrate/TMAO reductase-like tetraheme cytochrome c subunit